MPVTSVYRTGGGTSITSDTSADRNMQSIAAGAAATAIAAQAATIRSDAIAAAQASSYFTVSGLSAVGITISGGSLTTVSGLTVGGVASISGSLSVSGAATLSGLTVQNALNVSGAATLSGLTR
jgi:hypothetical protein